MERAATLPTLLARWRQAWGIGGLRARLRDAQRRTQELEQLNEQMRSVVDNVADAIVTLDDQALIRTWNRAAETIFGHSWMEVVGQRADLLLGGAACLQPPWFAAPTGRALALTGRRRNGTEFPMEVALGEFRLGGRRHLTCILRDVTDRRAAEAALREAKDAADAANHAKSQFIANMSHEIRTPLGAVIGFSELLANPEQRAEERAESLAAIKRNGELLSNIINDVLDLAKVEAGRLSVERRDVALADVITDLTSLLGLQAREKGISLRVAADGTVPRRFQTDALRLRQALVNVVGNAVKFTERGGVDVAVRLVPGSAGPRLAFVVRDTGCGIPPNAVARVFRPFVQVDASSTRRRGGAGLGLELARQMARLLGGDVELTASQPGVGSTFTVSVDPGPMSFDRDLAAPPAAAVPVAGRPSVSLAGALVLLVDDNADNRLLATRFLTLAGARVEVACNGEEAVQRVFEDAYNARYDVVIMDIQMPVMDGYEAITQLRRRGYRKPVLALTAHAMKEELEKCIALGFNGHMSKPINRQALIDAVAHFRNSDVCYRAERSREWA